MTLRRIALVLALAAAPSVASAEAYKEREEKAKRAQEEREAAREAKIAAARERFQAEERVNDESRELNARLQERSSDPRWMRPVLSALLCAAEEERSGVLASIAVDKRYSKVGGAVDLRRRSDLQDDLRAADEKIDDLKARLRSLRTKRLRCGDKLVGALIDCDNEGGDACKADEMAGRLELLHSFQASN